MAALDEFISSFSKYGGPALLNRFEVVIIAPAEAVPSYDDDRHVSFRVETVTMPGRNIRTVTNENIYGPTHEMAQGLTYAEDVSMTFFLSAEHFERNYFMMWMDYIYKPNTFDLEYYQAYHRPINIYQLGKNGKRLSGVRLNQAFPKTLGPIEFSQASSDLGRQEVSFAFKDITFLDANGRSISNPDRRAGTYSREQIYPVSETPALDRTSSIDAFRRLQNINAAPIEQSIRTAGYTPDRFTPVEERRNFPNADVDEFGPV
jgi:hypothetical protein